MFNCLFDSLGLFLCNVGPFQFAIGFAVKKKFDLNSFAGLVGFNLELL
jgi:hypothetical protein